MSLQARACKHEPASTSLEQEDAAYPSHTFAGTQAASLCPDPHHPVHRHRMGTADWTACRLRERRGERLSAGCGESAVERRTKPDADIRGTNCCADAVHSLTILCLHGGSHRHAGNGVSCLTMPTLEPPTAHLRTGHAHEGRGRRLLSRALPRRGAGCQPRAGSPAPCAPPTERERQREGCTGPSSVAPRSAPMPSQNLRPSCKPLQARSRRNLPLQEPPRRGRPQHRHRGPCGLRGYMCRRRALGR